MDMVQHGAIVSEMTRLASHANVARARGLEWLAVWYDGRIEALRGELLRAYLAHDERGAA